jgi:uncharacterized protein YcaQ
MPKPKPSSTPNVLSALALLPIRAWAASRSYLLDIERAAQKDLIPAGATRDLVVRGCREAAWNSKSWRVVQRARSILKLLREAEGPPAVVSAADEVAEERSRVEALRRVASRLGVTMPADKPQTTA